jgi:hypothetical protein
MKLKKMHKIAAVADAPPPRSYAPPLRAASPASASEVASSPLRLLALVCLFIAGTPVMAETAHPVIEGIPSPVCVTRATARSFLSCATDFHLEATVYNTLGLNDCPVQARNAITEEAMKQRFGAVTVLMNGPRYFSDG